MVRGLTGLAERGSGARPLAAGRFLSSFYLFFVLGLLVPVLQLRFAPDARVGASELLLWAVIGYAGYRIASLGFRAAPRLLSLMFWLFVYVWLGVAPFAQSLSGSFPLHGVYPDDTRAWAVGLVIIGLVAYEIGVRRADDSEPSLLERGLSSRVVDARSAGWFASLGLLTCLALIASIGGFGVFWGSRTDVFLRVTELMNNDSAKVLLYLQGVRSLAFVSLFVLCVVLRSRRGFDTVHARLWAACLLIALTGLNALLSSPINSPRYWVGTIGLSLAVLIWPWRRRAAVLAWTVMCLALLVVVFPYADLFRVTTDVDLDQVTSQSGLVVSGDYDAFQQLMNGVVYVGEKGHSFGRQIAGAVLFWVPRRLWPTKPIDTGEMVAEHMVYENTNLSMPLWGEAYVDGGVLLVVLVFFFYGLVSRRLENRFLDEDASRTTLTVVLTPVLGVYQVFLLRGTLMSALAYLVPVILFSYLSTRRRRS